MSDLSEPRSEEEAPKAKPEETALVQSEAKTPEEPEAIPEVPNAPIEPPEEDAKDLEAKSVTEAPKVAPESNPAEPKRAIPVTAAGDEIPQLWYVIHTQTGQELKVKGVIDSKIELGVLHEEVCEVLVPTERVAEIRGGKKQISERKFFPGYLLVRMRMTDESWHLVRTTPGVTGFIGAGRRPIPLSEDEVGEILRQTQERKDKPTPRVTFQKGEGVRVTEGPFTNFSGAVEEVNLNRGKVKVMVSIFGRQTPVELEFWQIERL